MGVNLFSSSDAHGTFRPVTLAATCATLDQLTKEEPQMEFLQMLTPILASSEACATAESGPRLPQIPDIKLPLYKTDAQLEQELDEKRKAAASTRGER
jgi:hypothetical protein